MLDKQNENINLMESARAREILIMVHRRKITRNILATVVVVFLTMCRVAQGGAVGDYFEEQQRKYKLREGIDKLIVAPDNQGVVADWTKQTFVSEMKNSGWTFNDDYSISTSDLTAATVWYLRKGDECVTIGIIVSSEGNQAVVDRLVKRVTNTSSRIFLHKRAAGPGDLYVAYATQGLRDMIWVYRNFYFHVEHRDESEPGDQELVFDTYALAREIQQYAEAHLVQNIQNHYPRIARVVVAPEKVHVGDDFTVTLNMEGDTDAKHYGMDFDRSDNLELESIDEGLSIRLQALAPGKGEVRFRVYDTRTLLMTQKTVQIDVRQKGK